MSTRMLVRPLRGHAKSKAVLGQTLTSGEGQHGTQALGNVHEEVRQDLKKGGRACGLENVFADAAHPALDRV